MKNLKYEKQTCSLCLGSTIIYTPLMTNKLAFGYRCMMLEEVCPICSGKGYLNILKTEEIENE